MMGEATATMTSAASGSVCVVDRDVVFGSRLSSTPARDGVFVGGDQFFH
jgi:hypothetical protein